MKGWLSRDELIIAAQQRGIYLGRLQSIPRRLEYWTQIGVIAYPKRVGQGRGKGVKSYWPKSTLKRLEQANKLFLRGVPYTEIPLHLTGGYDD
jgi:hypothetical protein